MKKRNRGPVVKTLIRTLYITPIFEKVDILQHFKLIILKVANLKKYEPNTPELPATKLSRPIETFTQMSHDCSGNL